MKRFEITINGKTYEVTTESSGNSHKVVVNGTEYSVTTKLIDSGEAIPEFQQGSATPIAAPVAPKKQTVAAGDTSGGNNIVAPMPGNITAIKVSVGDQVVNGTVVAEMEAMKMITPLPAPRGGVVKKINIQVGENVDQGAVLVELE